MNILFLTALKVEADPIISHFELVKDNVSNIYSNNNFFLFIVGVGYKKVGERLNSFIFNYNQWDTTTIVNIGIAGGNQNDTELGNIYRINSILDKCSGRTYFPDILLKSNINEIGLTTVLNPISDRPIEQRGLVDMEASAIYEFMSNYIPPHRICFLKIVSDYMDISQIKSIKVNSLIKNQMSKILLFINNIKNPKLLDRHILDQKEKHIVQKIIDNLRLTETQKNQLLESAENHKKLFKNLNILKDYLSNKPKNKKERNELFNAIREQISS